MTKMMAIPLLFIHYMSLLGVGTKKTRPHSIQMGIILKLILIFRELIDRL